MCVCGKLDELELFDLSNLPHISIISVCIYIYIYIYIYI